MRQNDLKVSNVQVISSQGGSIRCEIKNKDNKINMKVKIHQL